MLRLHTGHTTWRCYQHRSFGSCRQYFVWPSLVQREPLVLAVNKKWINQ